MVLMRYLRPGMKVRIVDEWNECCAQNSEGLMDRWLGQVMTVRQVNTADANMEEDQGELFDGGWYWNSHCIAEIIQEEPEIDLIGIESEALLGLLI